jgi:hypothetical protein
MKPIQIISQDLFDKVRSRFTNLEMGDETGAVTIDPAEARFFDFDFVNEGNDLGRVSISLNDLGSLKIYYSQGITENQDDPAKQMWYDFLKEMRLFAMRRLLRFDTRDISKSNLDKNDFQHLATTQGPKEDETMNMNESKWNHKSTKKTSRAVRGKTEVIVRHASPVDDMFPGSRSQRKNIKAIFIQNKDGERFKYPFIHPAGAFAMAQHVDHGGIPHDPAGKAIIGMSEEVAQLGEFQRKIQHQTLHDDATGIAERALGRLTELKAQIEALGKRHHYENWIAEFNEQEMNDDGLEIDDVTMEEYKQKFTQTNFQEELAGFFPLLHKIMRETNTVDLEEFVNETEEEKCNECGMWESKCECDEEVKEDAFSQFESWAEAVEQGQLTDDQIRSLISAVKENSSLEFGVDGQTAFEFFQGLGIGPEFLPQEKIDDLEGRLQDDSKDAEHDSSKTPITSFIEWANANGLENVADEISNELGLSQPETEPAPQPEPQAQQPAAPAPAPATPPVQQPVAEGQEKSMIKKIAEIVKSRYNGDNPTVGPFNGHEGILLDVEKEISEKFGDQAGVQARQLAEQFMEKLTQQWNQKHGNVANSHGDDGLARLKELLGDVKQKVESLDVSEESDDITDEGKGAIRKALAGLAVAGGLGAAGHALDQEELNASPQLTSLNHEIDQAKSSGDMTAVKSLTARRDAHKDRIRAGKGDIQGPGGTPVKVVPQEIDMIRKLAGLNK